MLDLLEVSTSLLTSEDRIGKERDRGFVRLALALLVLPRPAPAPIAAAAVVGVPGGLAVRVVVIGNTTLGGSITRLCALLPLSEGGVLRRACLRWSASRGRSQQLPAAD